MSSILPARSNTNSTSTSTSIAPPTRPTLQSIPSSRRDTSSQNAAPSNPSSAPASQRSSSIIRRKPKVRPQYPSDSEEKHVEYILVAGFDIDRGSVVEHQYPAPIGGDEHMLAELMLPDQAHVRSQDWTIFFLHKDASENEDAQERRAARRRSRRARKLQEQLEHDAQLDHFDLDQADAESEEDEALQSIEGPPLVYVLNLVNTKQDNTVKRYLILNFSVPCLPANTMMLTLSFSAKRRRRQGHGNMHSPLLPAHIQGNHKMPNYSLLLPFSSVSRSPCYCLLSRSTFALLFRKRWHPFMMPSMEWTCRFSLACPSKSASSCRPRT